MVARCVDPKMIGETMRNTQQTRMGSIFFEMDSPEKANILAEKVEQAIAGKARVTFLEWWTPVLLLGVPNWSDEADVRGSLAIFSVTPEKLTKVSLKGRNDGCGYGIALVMVPYNTAIKVAQIGFVVVGWIRFQVRLHGKKAAKILSLPRRFISLLLLRSSFLVLSWV